MNDARSHMSDDSPVRLPALPHDQVEADQLADSHLVGPDYRATVSAAPLRGVRRTDPLSQTIAN